VTLSFENGTKLRGLADCFDKAPFARPIDSYDWIWLPDDDLLADQETIDAFFQVVIKYDLKLAQPALHERSHIAHPITARHSGSLLRFTNFVEVMCPCFSRRALRRCSPYFRENVTTWGLDFLFVRLLNYPPRSVAIVDATPVVHTREYGTGAHYDRFREAGKDPYAELDEVHIKYGFTFQPQINIAVVSPGGRITDDLTGVVPAAAARTVPRAQQPPESIG
jgi:hypothetical protein